METDCMYDLATHSHSQPVKYCSLVSAPKLQSLMLYLPLHRPVSVTPPPPIQLAPSLPAN